ncbi:carbohydrate kinase family protein [Streptomyces glaucescens]|jgi:adenosine kinase|uniref:carbohydrate kinase family protein n=1 Tax=Streptomyces glaucescens TaxID=1907 RepID=UPI000A3B309A|nr:carbohydrate kinase family protein [Streptomyces glaucescens]
MRIAVTGSIATDHLMTFPGRITDQLLADRLAHVSLSFLVDSLEVRDGGVAANIAYGLAALGHHPLLVGAVGADFAPYGRRLADLGVDISAVHVSPTRHTARFLCTTDQDGNQIASFYPGAMSEAAAIDLADVAREHGGIDLVHVGADEPAAMLRHTRACRALGLPFVADPSQQLARLDGEQIRELVAGAHHLFTNEYEQGLLLAKSGWTRTDVLRQVGTWVTTLGEKGSRIERAGEPVLDVPAVAGATVADPTGVGDAFRAGYLASSAKGKNAVACAQAGAAVAALALASVGTQTYTASPTLLRDLLTTAYEAVTRPVTGLPSEGARP